MSRVETRHNILSINSISPKTVMDNLFVSDLISSSVFKSEVKNITRTNANYTRINTTSSIAEQISKSIESPIIIKKNIDQLKKEFSNNNVIENVNFKEIKSNIYNKISKLPLKISDQKSVNTKLVELKNSTLKNINTNVNAIVNELQIQHSEVFSKELSHIIVKASSEAGYKNIDVKIINNGTPLITALNKDGKGIISEIRHNKVTGSVDIVSEATGMPGGSCSTEMQKFDANLRKYGVKFSSMNTEITGGNCLLDSTKLLRNSINRKKSDEAVRNLRKKLNINLKHKL